jgi:hypothetical protein
MSKWFSGFLVLVAFTQISWARTAPSDLKDQLYAEMTAHHHSLGYRRAREVLLGKIHLQNSNGQYFIKDVYCEKEFGQRDFSSNPPGPGQIPKETILNTEHTWPQSRFGGGSKDFQKSDMHHLYPSDNQLNSVRGNHKFGEVNDPERNLKCPQSRIGRDPMGNWIFEPPKAHRGNVARALFYFSIRYRLAIQPDEEATLRKWNMDDPVDDFDRYRNDEIEKAQGNRNPFVDNSALADQIADF